ncbi:MAG: hypothetical protein VB064_11175 [Oscillospiraceae bacterium]|nr:hypothetical protein [Oscillospiraceae bacterium]
MKSAFAWDCRTSAERAAGRIESGDTVWIGGLTEGTRAFLDALAERRKGMRDVTILAAPGVGNERLLDEPVYRDAFSLLLFFGDALTQAYRGADSVDQAAFLSGGSDAAAEMLCRHFGINALVVGVPEPDVTGTVHLEQSASAITLAFSRRPELTKRFALIEPGAAPGYGTALPLTGFECFYADTGEAAAAV